MMRPARVAPDQSLSRLTIGNGGYSGRGQSPSRFGNGADDGRMSSPNGRMNSPSRSSAFGGGNNSPGGTTTASAFRKGGSPIRQFGYRNSTGGNEGGRLTQSSHGRETPSPPPMSPGQRGARFSPTFERSSFSTRATSSHSPFNRGGSAFQRYDSMKSQQYSPDRGSPSSPTYTSRNRSGNISSHGTHQRNQRSLLQQQQQQLQSPKFSFGDGTRFAPTQKGGTRAKQRPSYPSSSSRGGSSSKVRPITAPAVSNTNSPEAQGRGQGLNSSIGNFRASGNSASGGGGINGGAGRIGGTAGGSSVGVASQVPAAGSSSTGGSSPQQLIVKPRPNSLPPQSSGNSDALDGYTILRVIGKGSFGKVLLVRDNDRGDLCALKALVKARCREARHVRRARTERTILTIMDHPFICKLRHAFQDDDVLFFVLDYCPGGELFFHLSRLRSFPEPMARFYGAEIALAIEYIHSHKIIYRDLKPENILLAADGHVRLVDFGLARMDITSPERGANSFCGTYEYLAPEILLRAGHGLAVDWWNLGMVIYEMLTGLPPWYTKDQKKLFERICHAQLVIPASMSSRAAELVTQLLVKDPKARCGSRSGLSELRRLEFFGEGFDWAALQAKKLSPPMMPCKKKSIESATNFESQFTNLPIEGMGVFAVEGHKSRDTGSDQTPAGLGFWQGWDCNVLQKDSPSDVKTQSDDAIKTKETVPLRDAGGPVCVPVCT